MRGCANKSAPKPSLPPLCFGCARPMQLVRKTPRFGELPDVCTLECRACGVWHIEEGDAVLCRPADLGAVMAVYTGRAACLRHAGPFRLVQLRSNHSNTSTVVVL